MKTTNHLTKQQVKNLLQKPGMNPKNYKKSNEDPHFRKSVFKMASFWVFGVAVPLLCSLLLSLFLPGKADGPTGSYFFYATLVSLAINAATLIRSDRITDFYTIKDNWYYDEYQGVKTFFWQRNDGWKGLVGNIVTLWIIAIFQFIIF